MKIFSQFPWMHAVISQKTDGNMRIGPEIVGLDRTIREENRKKFLQKENFSFSLVTPYLVHGNAVAVVRDITLPYLQDTDAVVTGASHLPIGVTVADCVAVFFVDPVLNVIGLAHAGWRGLTSGVLEKTVDVFVQQFHSDVRNIFVAIGPHIGACHFEVSKDVFEKFAEDERFEKEEKLFVDLSLVCTHRLISKGIELTHTDVHNECTTCEQDIYFSHRRDKKADIEAMLAVIEICVD